MNFYQTVGYLFFGTRLKRLSEFYISDVNKIYKKHKISFDASWFPVFYILSKEGEVSIRRISNELYISHSAASQMVSSLQEKGYVKSKVSKEDARHKVVTFTAKGEKLKEKVQPVWDALQVAMEEIASEQAATKKLLQSLSSFENSLMKEGLYERVEKTMK
ncbi:MAG TPA: MarR family winged helix-turn-helix transcriptional regulator [Panacibacter sp.]|mgnify:FL=1|nr:MarR family winged helix-turn-helix transcriptional regulator [Panacibacter sp.]HNP43542.1 MarR family winged helix-turn-helix transcriptional regulator [Panacibacter sp.]